MPEPIPLLLLLALPASGKSEIRKYLEWLDPEVRRRDLHLGPTVQLDDFPYVHWMRRIDDELAALGAERIFFHSPERPFRDGRDWGTLIELLNDAYEAVHTGRPEPGPQTAEELFEQVDRAAGRVGIPPRLAALAPDIRHRLAVRLEPDARRLTEARRQEVPESLEDRTIVIEFARGGPEGAHMPLPAPHGYRHSLSLLDPAILERACVLYVWVTPEESRRKNEARADPDDPGSILHHGVPIEVMRREYGCDDIDWLASQARVPGTLPVEAHGRTFDLPFARYDNRVDTTSFLRGDPSSWPEEAVQRLHEGLRRCFSELARRCAARDD